MLQIIINWLEFLYRKTYRDALGAAGTSPTLMAIEAIIKSRKVQGEEAAQLIAMLPQTVRTPTDDYLKTLFVSNIVI